MGVTDGNAQRVEIVMQLLVVSTEIDQSGTFFLDQWNNRPIVVTLVLTTNNQNGLGLHGLQCIPACINIRSLRVVDILNTTHHTYFLQTMLYTREVAERFTDHLFLDTGNIRSDTSSQRVIYIMLTRQTEGLLFHIKGLRLFNFVLSLLNITDTAFFFQLRERILDSFDVILFQFLFDNRVVIPIDEGILRSLILYNAHLGIHIVLHLEIVTIQMVRGDIQQNGHIGTEIIHIVQLKRRQFNDVVFMRIFSNLQSQRVSDIASQTGIITSLLEDMVDKTSRCGLTIRTRNTDHLRVGIAPGKLYLTDDMDTLLLDFDNHRSSVGNTRTLDYLIGIQNLFFRMMAFLPTNLVVIHQLFILVVDFRHITDKHVETLLLGQNGSTCSALTGS